MLSLGLELEHFSDSEQHVSTRKHIDIGHALDEGSVNPGAK